MILSLEQQFYFNKTDNLYPERIFFKCYKKFLGYLYCVDCAKFFKAIQPTNSTYRSHVISSHFSSRTHQLRVGSLSDLFWPTFQPSEVEQLILIWIRIMARNGTPWSVFKKDEDLMEAMAIVLESQTKKKIDRNSLHVLFPSDRSMRRKLPLMKKKIDG